MTSNERIVEVLNWYDSVSNNNEVINQEEECMLDVDVDLSYISTSKVCLVAARNVVPTNKQQYVVTGAAVVGAGVLVGTGYVVLAPIPVVGAAVHNALYNNKGEYQEIYQRTYSTSYASGMSLGRSIKALFNR